MNTSLKLIFIFIQDQKIIYLVLNRSGAYFNNEKVRWVTFLTGSSYRQKSNLFGTLFNFHRKAPEANPGQMPDSSGTHRLIELQEQEWKKIAIDLRDTVGQGLILLKNKILTMQTQLSEKNETNLHLHSLSAMVTESIQEIRNISYKIRPYELDLFGLTHALRSLAEQVGDAQQWPLTLSLESFDHLFTPENEIYIYRIWQDSLGLLTLYNKPQEVNLITSYFQGVTRWKLEMKASGGSSRFYLHKENLGSGLVRLQEYLKIVAGTIAITEEFSEVTIITTIHLTIPTHHEKA